MKKKNTHTHAPTDVVVSFFIIVNYTFSFV